MSAQSWHRGSRFYAVGRQALWLAATLVVLCICFARDSVGEALLAFGGTVGTLLGGGTWSNIKERDPEFQRAAGARETAVAEREVVAEALEKEGD